MKAQAVQLICRLHKEEVLEPDVLRIVVVIQKSQGAEAAAQIPAIFCASVGVRAEDVPWPELRRPEEEEGRDTRYGCEEESKGGSGVSGCGEEILRGVRGGVAPVIRGG